MESIRKLIPALILSAWSIASCAEEDISPSTRETPPELAEQIKTFSGRASDAVAYRHVNVFAATNDDRWRTDTTVFVVGDRIAGITPSDRDATFINDDVEVVDGTGWYVTPGLFDSHVHLATWPARGPAEATLKRQLYGGVTNVRDMAGDVRALADLSRAALINEIQSPDIHYSALMAGESFFQDPRTTMSGLGVTPGAVPWMQAIDEATDIPLAVAQAKGTWATGIKIYANLSGTLVQRIIREGRRQGMPVWTHAKVYPANPFDSVGAHAVSHACMIARHVLENGRQFDAAAGDTLDYGAFSVDAPEFVRYAEALASSGTNFDATMLVYREQTLPDCGLDAVVAPIVAALHHSGVNIVAGTDADTPPEDPFPAIIEEMELLSKVEGMTNADVIRSATANAAEAMLLLDEFGTIESGKFANMVFLTDDPLDDIANFRSVVLTVKRGHRYFRSEYVHEPIPELPFPGRQ